MNSYTCLDIHFLQVKFQKVCKQLATLLQQGKAISFLKIAALIKRRERYARQLLLQSSTACKTGSLLLLASVFTFTSKAQDCKQYVLADSANPIRRPGLPQDLWQPVFVDIDGDGDLDCYETNPSVYYGGSNRIEITLLRNTGTQQLPYYVQDSVTGFSKNLNTRTADVRNVTKLQFADIDNDGDYDCFIAGYYKYSGYLVPVRYYKNVGTAAQPQFVNTPNENPFAGLHFSLYLSYALADLDQDGDLDLIASDAGGTGIYRNIGTKTQPKFSLNRTSYELYSPQYIAYDYNKDGRTDIFNGFNGLNGFNGVTYYRNTGTTDKAAFVKDTKNTPQLALDDFTTFTFADLNNDGVAEAFSITGKYAIPTVVATITAKKTEGSSVILHADPTDNNYTYQWYKNGNEIAGAVSPVYTAFVAGRYWVNIKNECGTGTSLPYYFTGNSADEKSINTFANRSTLLTAYPNPFTDYFTLNMGNDLQNTVVEIMDLQGRIISKTKVNSTAMQLGSSLQKGIYIMQVTKNSTILLTQKIIKE